MPVKGTKGMITNYRLSGTIWVYDRGILSTSRHPNVRFSAARNNVCQTNN